MQKDEIKTTIFCGGCGDVLEETTAYTKPRELQPDELIQFETGEEVEHSTAVAAGIQFETGTAPVEPEPATFETEGTSLSTPISNIEIPPIIEETLDLTTAIRCADQYSPPDGLGRNEYKTALNWLTKQRPDKAEALIQHIRDPQAQAIVAHLAARPMSQAVAA